METYGVLMRAGTYGIAGQVDPNCRIFTIKSVLYAEMNIGENQLEKLDSFLEHVLLTVCSMFENILLLL
jgi:hypothetical protein